jgi:hypothetical protein
MRKYIVLIVIILAGTYYFNIGNDSKTDVKTETNNSVKDIVKTPVVKKTYRPENGYSPYNSFFGKGIYNNKTDNTISVSSPSFSDIVFLLKDINTNRTIRNEYIRSGSTFSLTGIPYGTYTFTYFSGKNWSNDVSLKNGQIKGGFTKSKSFSKSEKIKDRMTFEEGYYGTYTIKLTQEVNGNLETQSSNEDEFFN